ncbi:MAG: glycosyltransferase family 2 protein [Melioribacteraceae bacterium]|nr:glycosyltransferase family 2 protein [Melioribacteraceae bacterium]MCF8262911.1 glycosyltransferase family 2 protein [Melioribacteraceae bacterium]MCF8411934.1 glycosyltransferase family 2 protein [Melioribacteraceae bacterium]MCF8430931.1 glycosyltransferase family 2 protein [Melioribacteraceae bacterium]
MIDAVFYIALVFNSVCFMVLVYNLFTAPLVQNKHVEIDDDELVSVLIPARNEAANIKNCLISIKNQSYKNLEIIVLNDESTDETEAILSEFKSDETRFRFINGEAKPEGWIGKNWACHQLGNEANGKFLLFVDADVTLKEHAISQTISAMQKNNLSMLSVFPTQWMNTFGEYLVVPLMNWLLLSFLPLKQVFASNNKSFVAANGQFLLFKKSVYKKLGGHEKVKDKVVEDMEFARAVKNSGEKMMTLLGWNSIYCKMYSGFRESINGFSKNFFPGFNISYLAFSVFVIFAFSANYHPFILVFINSLFIYPVLIVVSARMIISHLSKQNIFFNTALHPFQFLIMLFVGIKSMIDTKRKKVEWKGRLI